MPVLHEGRPRHSRVSKLSGRISGELGMPLAGPAWPQQARPRHHLQHRTRRVVRGRPDYQKNWCVCIITKFKVSVNKTGWTGANVMNKF